MKLPKIDKIKKPSGLKMPGGLNTPVKRFTIKNRFLQKNLISLIVIAVLAIGTGTAYGTLSSRDADMGNDPVNGVNKDRFQVLVSGNGYKLSKNQEKNYKLQKKQNQVNAAKAAQAAQNNPNTIRTSNGNRVFRTSAGNFRYKPRTTTFKTSKVPRITTDLSTEIAKLPDKRKAGDTLKIRVAAYAYPYGTQNIISSDNIEVSVSSGKVELVKENKTGCIYNIELGEGKGKNKVVTITVTATDKKLKKTAKAGPFPIKDVEGSGNSGKTDPTEPSSSTDPTEPSTPTAEKTVNVSKNLPSGMSISDSTESSLKEKALKGESITEVTVEASSFDLGGYDSSTMQSLYKSEKGIEVDPSDEEAYQKYKEWYDDKEAYIRGGGPIKDGKPFESTKLTVDRTETDTDITLTISISLY